MNSKYVFNHEHKVFTCDNPKNTFIIDYSNGYPVKLTTNVTEKTKWSDIFKGKYDLANPDGTPEYLNVNGKKYTYVDKKWAVERMGYEFVSLDDTYIVTRWKSKFDIKMEHFCRKAF